VGIREKQVNEPIVERDQNEKSSVGHLSKSVILHLRHDWRSQMGEWEFRTREAETIEGLEHCLGQPSNVAQVPERRS
jgi:hypothetical protein